MKITIYGKPNCSFCVMAKDMAQHLQNQGKATYTYVDMAKRDMTAADLSSEVGKEVRTVPQILVNDHHIGGYNEMNKLLGSLL